MSNSMSLEELLTRAFTRVAQHACRQGEKGERQWPSLSELPAPQSWDVVGRQYAREFAIELVEHYYRTGGLMGDLVLMVSSKRDETTTG